MLDISVLNMILKITATYPRVQWVNECHLLLYSTGPIYLASHWCACYLQNKCQAPYMVSQEGIATGGNFWNYYPGTLLSLSYEQGYLQDFCSLCCIFWWIVLIFLQWSTHCDLVTPHGDIELVSTLAEVMTCCLAAPSHYLNQWWPIISTVQWDSSDNNFTRDTSATSYGNYQYLSEISFKSLRGHCVDPSSLPHSYRPAPEGQPVYPIPTQSPYGVLLYLQHRWHSGGTLG